MKMNKTEKDLRKEIEELKKENEKLRKHVKELENRHSCDLSVIFIQRRQIDFLMEGK